ncbi:MAG: ArnT family glycosyltransferase [Saprospiraceae bacterium]
MNRIAFFIFLILCCLPLFLHLDVAPLHLWDESRQAVNALEMLENGNWFVTHYRSEPDMWNTKPPLLIWLQVLCFKIFGVGVFAVRLPSALAGLATVLLLFFFCKKYLHNQLLGFCAAFVLLTTQGFISNHVTRTGDYDALLTFWTTLTVFLFFAWINSEDTKQKRNLLYATALSIAAAVLTKSIMGFVLLPPLFLFLIWKKQLQTLFTSIHFYGAVSIFLTIVLGYYFLRENQNPGYLEAVLENDIRGRYFETQEGNNRSFFFHMRKIYEERFVPWLYFLPLGFLATFFAKPRTKEFVKLLFFSGLFFLLIISFSQTNLIWYDAPLLSLWSVVVGLGIEKIIRMAHSHFSQKEISFRFSRIILTGAIGLAIFGNPYFKRVSDSYTFNKLWLTPERELFEGFMHRSIPLEYKILHWDINGQVVFLQQAYRRKGFDIEVREINQLQNDNSFKFVESELDFEIGEKVMMCESNTKSEFAKRYNYEQINHWSNCQLVKITRQK